MHPIEKSPHAELASSCLRTGVLGVRAAEMSIDAVEGYSREPILRPWRAGGTAREGAVDAHGDPGDVKGVWTLTTYYVQKLSRCP